MNGWRGVSTLTLLDSQNISSHKSTALLNTHQLPSTFQESDWSVEGESNNWALPSRRFLNHIIFSWVILSGGDQIQIPSFHQEIWEQILLRMWWQLCYLWRPTSLTFIMESDLTQFSKMIILDSCLPRPLPILRVDVTSTLWPADLYTVGQRPP